MENNRTFYDIEARTAVRLISELRKENAWLASVNDTLHKGLRDYEKLVGELQDTIRSLQETIASKECPQLWENERDCYDVNSEYEQP